MCSENLFKLTSMFSTYFYTKFQNFDILHTFLPLAVAKLSTLKQSLFFCPSCSFEVKTSLWNYVIEVELHVFAMILCRLCQ